MKLYTFDPKKLKKVLVGEIVGYTLYKDVTPKHFMRIVDGWGIQEGAFGDAIEKGVRKVVIRTDTGKQWESDMLDWMEHGLSADYGNGKQRFLSLKYMHTHKVIQRFIDPMGKLKAIEY